VISYALAVLAAAANAASNVLNRKASRQEPDSVQFRLRLLLDLARRRTWLLSALVMIISFMLSAAALGTGQLAAVQPLIALELPMTLIGGALFLGGRLGAREWSATAAMTGGVVGIIIVLDPQPGHPGSAAATSLILGSAANAAVVVALSMAARFLAPRSRWGTAGQAALLGVACGLCYGLAAAYTKELTGDYTAGGIPGVVTSWALYAAIVAGIAATWLLQNAYRAGRLAAAQPGVTLADPVVSMVWGIGVFGEHVRGPAFYLVALVPLLVLAAGAFQLSRSPMLRESGSAGDRSEPKVPAVRGREAGS
jgi:drug/metabolite transporter (DMT)-like permease